MARSDLPHGIRSEPRTTDQAFAIPVQGRSFTCTAEAPHKM
jgi:hypothetical protein